MLNRKNKISLLSTLGRYLRAGDERLDAHIHRASAVNPWFTREHIRTALDQIAIRYLDANLLEQWLEPYEDRRDPLYKIGVVAAGNIPLVCFHDVLSIFMTGNVAQVKLSERDPYLLPYLVKWLTEIEPLAESYFQFAEKLSDFDAIIATGSNNTSRYFESYFSKYPHIIRRNRNAVAVITGDESSDEISALGHDIFDHFGLGCRNVAHLFLPQNYLIEDLAQAFEPFESIKHHNKYRNNLDYNAAIAILNKTAHILLPHVLITENPQLISPIGTLHYTRYDDVQTVVRTLDGWRDDLQCVVTGLDIPGHSTVGFGQAQSPALDDYADGVNTLDFLFNLKTP